MNRSYCCIGLNSCLSEAWVGELPLPLPHSTITDQQAIPCQAAAWKECSAFLQHCTHNCSMGLWRLVCSMHSLAGQSHLGRPNAVAQELPLDPPLASPLLPFGGPINLTQQVCGGCMQRQRTDLTTKGSTASDIWRHSKHGECQAIANSFSNLVCDEETVLWWCSGCC